MADNRKLSKTAYEIEEGEEYVPYTHGQQLSEFTFKAAISGIILGMVFGAANTYLGLKAGLTISTSIPVAVLTVVVFKLLSALGFKHSILEANQSIYISIGLKHRLANPGDQVLEIIEVQTGALLSEDDIERFDDQYGR